MNIDLSGRNALVCGASEGIGKASAKEIASLGANVTLLATVVRQSLAILLKENTKVHLLQYKVFQKANTIQSCQIRITQTTKLLLNMY